MSAKDLVLDFLNYIFFVLLVIFCILYFIVGDNFASFSSFLKSMVPLAFFGIIFLVRLKLTRSEIKKRKGRGETEIVFYLNLSHKLISDIIVFCTPILLGLFIYKGRGFLDSVDTLVLAAVFLIMFFWQKYIFSRERR